MSSKMFLKFITVALVIMGSEACAPPHSGDGGKITSNPSFSFSFYPPVSWTYSDNSEKTTFGQWGSAEDARRSIKNDIDSAIVRVLDKSGFKDLLNSAHYAIKGYNADVPFPIGTDPGDYVVELGAVTKRISTGTEPSVNTEEPTVPPEEKEVVLSVSTSDNVQNLQIKITNSPLGLSIDQWSQLARDAYAILSTRYKVHFLSDIKVDA